jgi:hypothetical protein
MKKLLKNRNNGMVKILTGMRRVGKSTLLFMLQEELKQSGVEEDQIYYLNMDTNVKLSMYTFDEIRMYKKPTLKTRDSLTQNKA